ncbi:hypothetical protein AIOL_002453 [Candidatus Rhodobacter oscarellae]|uniref:Uncharacterized protein n=1 Tax=Candidatus Rhodobacter oscarellae TaxID=1675527 RepID=A0A0J9GV88_9RHOB|nr:hypothetical protein [Candidatus Rhodobacter lobularis]KMW57488.1 hypothetical protein AIOL_002453 [Candidatus Rhodobacter lobularis]
MPDQGDILRACENMLIRCAGLAPGARVLIIREPPEEMFYWDCAVEAVQWGATALGFQVDVLEVPFTPAACLPPKDLIEAMRVVDLTVFLARCGDQIRYHDWPAGTRAMICYALDGAMLGSSFGWLDHHGMVAIRDAADTAIAAAQEIHVTCPAGTELIGRIDAQGPEPRDTTTIRFPLSVHTPVPARHFSGRVAQRGFLVGTGSNYYEPYSLGLEETLVLEIRDGRIVGFAGNTADVARAEAHYAHVAGLFEIDAHFVHSWHAGIHPGCAFAPDARLAPERWSNGAFGSPRILHVHSCGAYAPGEISLNVLDPTVRLDGVAIWEHGRLRPELLPGGPEILRAYPELAEAYRDPAQHCGFAGVETSGTA